MKSLAKRQKGITLIALVITIIVMLILVAVTITVALNGGLFNYARKASVDTNTRIAEEQDMADLESGMSTDELILKYTITQYSEDLLDEDGVLTQTTRYTDSNKETAFIPAGFNIVEGYETIDDGLVIQDKDENQFVWIPIEDGTFVRTSSASFSEDQTTDPTGKYDSMVASVAKYGGFYIGRYEAGTGNGAPRTSESDTLTDVIVQKGAYPYNNISWENAIIKSVAMYQNSDSVVSTLCYGVQWDSIMRFIEDKVNVKNGGGWGNYITTTFEYTGEYGPTWTTGNTETEKPLYTARLLQTGASERNKAKNIYDLAGNESEWSMLTADSEFVLCYGGSYGIEEKGANYHTGFYHPGGNAVGFRPALYLL